MIKQIILVSLTALLFIYQASAQDFEGTKIYINPGHGGNDPANDRFMSETGFWESESNLTKGLYLRDLLENQNAVVFMSRTQNRDQDDLPLSQIDADANANNVDIFHSIHSNGFQGNANYTLLLYKETNGSPVDPQSQAFCNIIVDELYKAHRTTGKYNRGDYNFLGFNLGVLRYLNYNIMRGTLSEGSFHDYIPESWRLMSITYRKHEAIALLRSLIKFLGLDNLSHGVIAGLVRAKEKQVTYDYKYINQLPNDRKRAINNTKVTLLPTNKIFFTDNNNNGFYMFDSLDPGSYQVVFESGEYNSDTVNVTVQANKTVFGDAFLIENPDKPPYIYSSLPAVGENNVNTYKTIEINFSRSMDTESVQSAFSIDPSIEGEVSWARENQTLHFRPTSAYITSTNYTINISNDAKSVFGVKLDHDYEFTFTTANSHVFPKIVSYFPCDQVDSVFTHSEIIIQFDSEMRPETVESAFLIEPDASGKIVWDDNNSTLIFKPKVPFLPGRFYSVNITQNIKNYYGIGLESDFAFNFRTRKFNRVEVVQSYPNEDAKEVSMEVWVLVKFDKLIDESTATNLSFEVESEYGKNHFIRYFNITEENDKSVITFKPQPSLEPNTNYIMSIFPGISTVEGLMVQDTLRIPFLTQNTKYESGTILDGFESLDDWIDPNTAPFTEGVDSAETNVLKNSKNEISGSYRAELNYSFVDSADGIYHLYNPQKVNLGSNLDSEFGIWIFGDYSFNRLELLFDHDSLSNVPVVLDSIDWYGWKLVRVPLRQLNGRGEHFFHSVLIKQTSYGLRNSRIYLDDIQKDVMVGLPDNQFYVQSNPTEFKLYQNYPNPFNPITEISYYVPRAGIVKLTVYNLLGQEVKVLLNKHQSEGYFQINFNGAGLSSGLYFYTLQSGNFFAIRRMLLIK